MKYRNFPNIDNLATEQYQGNKLFKEGDGVYFDPIFNRIRNKKKPMRYSKAFKKGISAIKKSLTNSHIKP